MSSAIGGSNYGSGSGFGVTSGSEMNSQTNSSANLDNAACPTCGATRTNKGLEQFLGRLGISEEMMSNLKTSMANVDVEEYLNTARDYLKSGSNKAQTFAKENPGKVAAGVAVLAVGAGLLISSLNKD
jgi:hypothetical protein